MFNHLSLNQEIIYEYLISYKNIPNTSELYGPGVLTRFIKETGVYAIYFPKTNEVYFGSTQDLFTRRERHLYRLRAQQHRNKKVQIAFNESGINNILFLYHRTSSREEAYSIEQRLIDSYIDSGLLLNRSLDVYSSFRGLKGLERDAETRKNISIAAKLAYIKHPDKRSKVSVSKKKYYEGNPQVIKRISETTKKQWSNPETRGLLVKNA